MQLSIPPGSLPPPSAEFETVVGRLRQEVRQNANPEVQGFLLQELASAAEAASDEHRAAADLLAAINLDPSQLEPLEHLLGLLLQRKSRRNVPRLLERLLGLAATEGAAARAHLATAEFASDVLENGDEALASLHEACRLASDDPRVWLALQLQLADGDGARLARAEAVSHRMRIASSPDYVLPLALLRNDLAVRGGDHERALTWLSELDGEPRSRNARYRCLEGLAHKQRDRSLLAEALRGLTHDLAGRDLDGLAPTDDVAAVATVARALLLAQWEPECAAPAAAVRWALREPPTAVTLAAMLSRSATGQISDIEAISVSLRALQTTLRQHTSEQPSGAPRSSLENPTPWLLPFALRLNTAERARNPPELADALDAFAQFLEKDANAGPSLNSGRFRLLARLMRPAASHHPSLANAGAPLGAYDAARAARLLGARGNDAEAVFQSGEALLAHTTGTELQGLLLEQARAAVLGSDAHGLRTALEELAETATNDGPGGTPTEPTRAAAALFRVYLPGPEPRLDSAERLSAMQELAAVFTNAPQSWPILHWLLRALPTDDGAALPDWLTRVVDAHPEYTAAAWELFRRRHATGARDVADVLARAADSLDEPELRSALRLASAVVYYQSQRPELGDALLVGPFAAHDAGRNALREWSLRLNAPRSAERELRLVELEALTASPSALSRLRRAAALIAGNRPQEAMGVLAEGQSAPGEAVFRDACGLLALLVGAPSAAESSVSAAPLVAEMRTAEQLVQERRARGSTEALALSAGWAANTGRGYAALHFLVSSSDAASEEEIEARKFLAERLTDEARSALLAGASLLGQLHGRPAQPLAGEEPPVLLANLEQALPTTAPRQRAAALAQAAPLFSSQERRRLLLLAGYNSLFAGDPTRARQTFRSLTVGGGGGLAAWEGLRRAARLIGDRGEEAEACLRLGELSCLPHKAAALFKRRAQLLFELGDKAAAATALDRAVVLDPSDKRAFDLLVRALRAQNAHERILEVAAAREDTLEEGDEVGMLAWERARSYRALGRIPEALKEVKTLQTVEGDKPQTWLLASELHLSTDDQAAAASALEKLCALDAAPKRQRLLAGIAAADLYEKSLSDEPGAIRVLATLQALDLGGLMVVERLARICAHAKDWHGAAQAFLALAELRGSSGKHEEAARIALVIARDELEDDGVAVRACRKLLACVPTDAEAIDYLVAGSSATAAHGTATHRDEALELLAAAEQALRSALAVAPEPDGLARLARVAQVRQNDFLRFVAVGALAALGQVRETALTELEADLSAHLARSGESFSAGVLTALLQDVDPGVSDVFALLVPALAPLYAPPSDGVSPGASAELADEIMLWAKRFGLDELSLWSSDRQDRAFRLFPDERGLRLLISHRVKAPLTPSALVALLRELFSAVTATGVATLCSASQAEALLEGARLLATNGSKTSLDGALDLRDQLDAILSRKAKADLKVAVEEAPNLSANFQGWWDEVTRAQDRAAALVVADISRVLGPEAQRGARRAFDAAAESPRTLSLVRFVLTPRFAALRAAIGGTHE